jgi:Fe-S-cluster containining protein
MVFDCLGAGCSKCCIETYMPLSLATIARLRELGYKVNEFVVQRGGERRLRNREGKCFFLTDKGCKVYEDRPMGCRFYPLVFDLDRDVVVDPECAHGDQFEVDPDEAEKLIAFIRKLKREKKRKIPR